MAEKRHALTNKQPQTSSLIQNMKKDPMVKAAFIAFDHSKGLMLCVSVCVRVTVRLLAHQLLSRRVATLIYDQQ